MGYAHLVMDTRGQGSAWRQGDTPDPGTEGTSPHYPGFMTQGVLDPRTFYYRRLFVDAVRAVEAARSHPAFNQYAGPKDICVWHFNDHKGGESYQMMEKIKFLKRLWPVSSDA